MTEEQIAKSIWLNRAFHKDKKVKALKSLAESDKIRAEGMSKDNEGNDEGKSETRKNGTYEAYMKYLETEEKYQKVLCEYNSIRKEVETVIDKVADDELNALLTYRYLDGMTMESVAENMHYSVRNTKYKHKEALDKVCIDLHPLPVL